MDKPEDLGDALATHLRFFLNRLSGDFSGVRVPIDFALALRALQDQLDLYDSERLKEDPDA